MNKLSVIPAYVPRHKVRDIRSARRRKPSTEGQVVDLRAYAGRNVIRFAHKNEPTPAA